MTYRHASRAKRPAVAAAALVLAAGLAACGDTGEGAGDSADLFDDLSQELESLEDRVADLEGYTAGLQPEDLDDIPAGEVTAPFEEVGEEVTVTGEISELYDTTDSGAAFRITGGASEPVAVVSTDPPEELLDSDTVRVSGTVVRVDEAEFEQSFGIAADELLGNPEGFFVDADGEMAIAADSVEKVEG